MAAPPSTSSGPAVAAAVLSLRRVPLPRRRSESSSIDFELMRGQVAIIKVEGDSEASSLVDLSVGLINPPAGDVRFLDRGWRGLSYRECLAARGRIGAVVQTNVWPAHLSIAESILAPRLHHTDRPEQETLADATALARLFGLPGLPAGRRDTTSTGELVRAGCVRGFLGAPDLVLVQDSTLDGMAALGVAMAQAVAAVQDRGGAVLWIAAGSAATPAARFVQADQVLRLGEKGLIPVRRNQ